MIDEVSNNNSEKKQTTSPDQKNEEDQFDLSLRPQMLKDYVGQEKTKQHLKIFIEAAKQRKEPIEHVLVYGPPGLGKTTLANVLANEMNVNIKITSGPAIERAGDLASMLTNLSDFDVLFIDEIHRLPRIVEEVLYPAMEDFRFDIVLGKGPGARSVRLELPRFTIIGATTRIGQVSAPLRDRFGATFKLDYYDTKEIESILKRSADILEVNAEPSGIEEVAKRSRHTPRIANRLLRRVRDFAQVKGSGSVDRETAKKALDILEVDQLGLDKNDRKLLEVLITKFKGGPVGLNTLAAATGEEEVTIADIYEPYLMRLGFLKRTKQGRTATPSAYEHLNIKTDSESNTLL